MSGCLRSNLLPFLVRWMIIIVFIPLSSAIILSSRFLTCRLVLSGRPLPAWSLAIVGSGWGSGPLLWSAGKRPGLSCKVHVLGWHGHLPQFPHPPVPGIILFLLYRWDRRGNLKAVTIVRFLHFGSRRVRVIAFRRGWLWGRGWIWCFIDPLRIWYNKLSYLGCLKLLDNYFRHIFS